MVKRQTVWLSTMMVLSLMLIGYYTVNNGAGGTTSTTGGADSVTTSGAPGTDSGSGSSQASGSGSSTGQSDSSSSTSGQSNTNTKTSDNDWFITSRTTQEQKLAQQDDMYKEIISSDKSSNAQVVQAQQEDKQLTAIEGAMGQARDAVLAEGYPDCVIFPTTDTKTGVVTKVQVYVKADKLTNDKAIQIMNVVSQNMGIGINNIVVHEHK